jgi:DNA-binding HxlR family transcriptional regulator
MDHLIAAAVRLVSGKWKIALLGQLAGGPIRSSKLHSLIPQMSGKVFTQQVRALERDGLIGRRQALKAAKCVEYSITLRGARLWNSLELLGKWAENFCHQDQVDGDCRSNSKKQNDAALKRTICSPSHTPANRTTAVCEPNMVRAPLDGLRHFGSNNAGNLSARALILRSHADAQ